MALTNPRLAVGVGVVSAFLLIGGSGATVAFADPGGPRGSDRDNSSGRGDSRYDSRGTHGNGGRGHENGRDAPGAHRRGSDGPQIAGRQGIAVTEERGSSDGPPTRVGSGRSGTARLSPSGSDGGSDSGGGSGSGGPAATSAFEPPQVTFGNGRSPGVQRNDPRPRWEAPAPPPAEAPPPAPPAPAPPAPAPSWANRIATPPAVAKQFVVAPAAELTDPLWGIAGLLLIPAAGAALGYRQARAAQSAERLHRS